MATLTWQHGARFGVERQGALDHRVVAPNPETTPRSRRGDLVVLVLVLGAIAAAASWWLRREPNPSELTSTPTATTTASSVPVCETTIDSVDLPLEPAPPFEPPASTLLVEASLPLAALASEVDARLPKTLDAGNRKPIGAAGEITYQVTRGSPSVTVKDGSLVVDIPISADVEVCKPLGPLCPTYGRCQPKLSSRTTLPLEPKSDWTLEGATVKVTVSQGCRVAGLDVTDEVEKAAAKGQRRAQDQIAAAMKKGAAALKEQMGRLTKPLPLAPGQCVLVRPNAARHRPLTESRGQLQLGVAIEGSIATADCDAATKDPVELPPIEQGPLGEGRIHLVNIVPYAELLTAFTAERPEGVELHALRAHGSDLAIELTLSGDVCGRTWAVVKPRLEGSQLRLEAVSPIVTLSTPLTLEPWPGLERLDAVEGLTATPALEERPTQLVVTPKGLAIIRARSGAVALSIDPAALHAQKKP